MSDFHAVITQAGITAAIAAHAGQVSIAIHQIAVGRSGYTPGRSQTRLVDEVDRVPVHSSERLGDHQWRVMGSFQRGQYTAREIGLYLQDGTLFAVFSDPAHPLFYKTAGATVIQPFTLALTAVPAEAIRVESSGDLAFFYGQEFMHASIAQTSMAAAMLAILQRQLALTPTRNTQESE